MLHAAGPFAGPSLGQHSYPEANRAPAQGGDWEDLGQVSIGAAVRFTSPRRQPSIVAIMRLKPPSSLDHALCQVGSITLQGRARDIGSSISTHDKVDLPKLKVQASQSASVDQQRDGIALVDWEVSITAVIGSLL